MALEVDHAQAVRTHRQMHPGLVALHQHLHPGDIELLSGDFVPTGVRDIEQGINIVHQRMSPVHDPMAEHAP